jgi:hypothetical protein
MFIVLILLFLLLIFDIAAMRWGFDSRDRPESEKWEQRQLRAWSEICTGAHSS